jgi:hypothetical protein
MLFRIKLFSILAFCTALVLAICCASAVQAQAILNLRIGDNSSRLSSLGAAPSASMSYKSFKVQKWILVNKNEISVTTSQSGKIVYIESDWGGKASSSECDLQGLVFGMTTLSDIRKRFGSNGFGFENRDSVIKLTDGIVMLNSFEVGTNVVTFVTRVSNAEALPPSEADKDSAVADRAKLDAISISQREYAAGEWGKRIYDPAYKKIEWK